MITRELKLKLTKKQELILNSQIIQCSSLYNLIVRRIKLSAQDKIYYSKYEFFNQFKGHSKKTDLHSRTIQAIIEQAYISWDRCFKKLAKEPKLKSVRNKLNSIPFPDPIKRKSFEKCNRIKFPTLGSLKFCKQEIPEGNIKQSRIIKRASGWYLSLIIDTNHSFQIKQTEEQVGIDTGFKDLAILSNGKKYENQRNYVKSQKRLGQAQRGKNKKLVARLHERIKNQRKDYNHKVSKEIVQNYKEIYITKDNLKGQSKKFGKSVSDAGISQLRNFILYKCGNHSRVCKLVDSKYTTMTCSKCKARNGPTGLNGLAVRQWECACGAIHDRDINSALNILNVGLGINLVQL
jgi:putative transposase